MSSLPTVPSRSALHSFLQPALAWVAMVTGLVSCYPAGVRPPEAESPCRFTKATAVSAESGKAIPRFEVEVSGRQELVDDKHSPRHVPHPPAEVRVCPGDTVHIRAFGHNDARVRIADPPQASVEIRLAAAPPPQLSRQPTGLCVFLQSFDPFAIDEAYIDRMCLDVVSLSMDGPDGTVEIELDSVLPTTPSFSAKQEETAKLLADTNGKGTVAINYLDPESGRPTTVPW